MPDVHAARRARLAAILTEREVDAALVTTLVNVRYLTGFTGSNAALLVGADGTPLLATDGRYADQSLAEAPDVERVVDRATLARLVESLPAGTGSVALETHTLSVDAHASLVDLLEARGATPARLEQAVEELRVVKDDTEVDALRRACAISVEALAAIHAGPLLGRTEREIARDLEWRMYGLGAEAIAFDTIVATGPNSAIPHHQPTDREVRSGDLLKIDFGARVDGYHADCTRTVVVGRAADWQREAYDAVRAAQATGVEAMVAGRPVAESDAAARAVLDDAGLLEAFTTGIGHGVGLVIHEDPFIGPKHDGRLLAGTTATMEPGVYLTGRGGVRIEDTLVVTAGPPDVLTAATTDLQELG
ncbi:M24 family metallopeptidase [Solicola sp. PLA-1-18]|uniref:M24 family metallopeptidase n=1 Tax=Solicola sp. PLA-1-18 TaxID=3380532 RepID=UPI003B7E13FD